MEVEALAYAAGAAKPGDVARIERHVAACAACRQGMTDFWRLMAEETPEERELLDRIAGDTASAARELGAPRRRRDWRD
jgi:hypothetical protein